MSRGDSASSAHDELVQRLGPPIPVTNRLSGSACKIHFDGRDLKFEHCAQLDPEIQIFWSIQTYRVETVVYSTRQRGWIGVGWGYSAMEGANAVVAYKERYSNRAQIGDYHLGYKAPDGVTVEGFQDLSIARATAGTHHIAMMFARPLGRITHGNVPALNESSRVPLIYAYGDHANFMGLISQHTKRGWTYVNFGASKVSLSAGGNSYSTFGSNIGTHAWLMGTAWALIFPLAMAAMRSRVRPNMSFQLHRALNTLAITITLFGFFVAVVNGSHTYVAHMTLGWGVLFVMLIQPIGLIWKQKSDHWSLIHRSLGRIVLFLGISNVYIGLFIYGARTFAYVVVTFFVLVGCVAAIAFSFGIERRFISEDETVGLVDSSRNSTIPDTSAPEVNTTSNHDNRLGFVEDDEDEDDCDYDPPEL